MSSWRRGWPGWSICCHVTRVTRRCRPRGMTIPGRTPPKPKRSGGGGKRSRGKQPGAPGSNLAWAQVPDDRVDRFYAGKAPVTRRSGKSELVVASRLACNRYLAEAVQQWAFTSLRTSGWAREFYDTQRSRGKKTPCRPASAGQPLAGGPQALPDQQLALRRERPRRQPQPRPRPCQPADRPCRLKRGLTKGVS